uniref:Uncharacterized protein n=1 Tax=Arundo donax TaxID=35708 RepID=A0A0A9GVV6_ARUDO
MADVLFQLPIEVHISSLLRVFVLFLHSSSHWHK